MAETTRFGLEKFGGALGGSIADNGGKYSSTDRDLQDRLFAFFEGHQHDGGSDPLALASPANAPTAVQSDTGGTIARGGVRYYVFSVVDQWGFESAMSPELAVTLPDAIEITDIPVVTGDAVGGSALAEGSYYYALTGNTADGETVIGPEAILTIQPGQNQADVVLPALPSGVTSWNVWRMGVTEDGWTKVFDSQAGSITVDDVGFPSGACLCDPTSQPPTDDLAPSGTISVTVTPASSDLVGAASWRLYESDTPGVYGNASLVAAVVPTIVGGTPPADYLDTGAALLTGQPLLVSTCIAPSHAVAGGGGAGGGGADSHLMYFLTDAALPAFSGGDVLGTVLEGASDSFGHDVYWLPQLDGDFSGDELQIVTSGVYTLFAKVAVTGAAAGDVIQPQALFVHIPAIGNLVGAMRGYFEPIVVPPGQTAVEATVCLGPLYLPRGSRIGFDYWFYYASAPATVQLGWGAAMASGTPTDADLYPAPAAFAVADVGTGDTLHCSWTSDPADEGYQIAVYDESGALPAYQFSQTAAAGASSVDVSGLSAGHSYKLVLVADKGFGGTNVFSLPAIATGTPQNLLDLGTAQSDGVGGGFASLDGEPELAAVTSGHATVGAALKVTKALGAEADGHGAGSAHLSGPVPLAMSAAGVCTASGALRVARVFSASSAGVATGSAAVSTVVPPTEPLVINTATATGSGTSADIAMPAGALPGDLLIIGMAAFNNGTSVTDYPTTPPAGFTNLYTPDHSVPSTGFDWSSGAFYKYVDGTEGSTVHLSTVASNPWEAWAMVVRGGLVPVAAGNVGAGTPTESVQAGDVVLSVLSALFTSGLTEPAVPSGTDDLLVSTASLYFTTRVAYETVGAAGTSTSRTNSGGTAGDRHTSAIVLRYGSTPRSATFTGPTSQSLVSLCLQLTDTGGGVQYVGGVHSTSTGGTITPGYPSGIAAGDLGVLIVSSIDVGQPTTITGWTKQGSTYSGAVGGGSVTETLTVWTRTLTGAEISTSIALGNGGCASIRVYRNAALGAVASAQSNLTPSQVVSPGDWILHAIGEMSTAGSNPATVAVSASVADPHALNNTSYSNLATGHEVAAAPGDPMLVVTATGSAVTGAAHNVTWPSGIMIGDLAVLLVSSSLTNTPGAPSGFTVVEAMSGDGSTSPNSETALYWKICTGTESGSLAIAGSAADGQASTLRIYRHAQFAGYVRQGGLTTLTQQAARGDLVESGAGVRFAATISAVTADLTTTNRLTANDGVKTGIASGIYRVGSGVTKSVARTAVATGTGGDSKGAYALRLSAKGSAGFRSIGSVTNNLGASGKLAQQFKPQLGLTVKKVRLRFTTAPGAGSFTVGIASAYSAGVATYVGSTVTVTTDASTPAKGAVDVTFTTGVALTAGTQYWLVLDGTSAVVDAVMIATTSALRAYGTVAIGSDTSNQLIYGGSTTTASFRLVCDLLEAASNKPARVPSAATPPSDLRANAPRINADNPSGSVSYDVANYGATEGSPWEDRSTASSGSSAFFTSWVRYDCAAGGTARFDTVGTLYDTVIRALDESGTEIGFDDDSGPAHGGFSGTSWMTFTAVAGKTYYIRAGAFSGSGPSGDTGAISELNWSVPG